MQRLAARLSYDGAGFRGFQSQPGARTVEGVLRLALREAGLPDVLAFAGRTDAGVHARGQVIVFRVPPDADAAAEAAQFARRLPPDVRFEASAACPARFHPRWSAIGKLYEYRLAAGQGQPRPDVWDAGEFGLHGVDRLETALAAPLRALRDAPVLAGFTGAGAKPGAAPPLTALALARDGTDLILSFEGPAFRRYAVRHMVGAAVAEAAGLLPEGSCGRIALAAPPCRHLRAPAQALTLVRVYYPPGLDPFPAKPPG